MNGLIDWGALWRVAALSAAFGVGVVALYAVGVAAMVAPEGAVQAGRGRRVLAVGCFVVCLAVIAFGIRVMLDK